MEAPVVLFCGLMPRYGDRRLYLLSALSELLFLFAR
jgi:hypothetical protein